MRGSLGCLQQRAGKQEVAGALGRAPRLASAYWQRKKRTRGEGGGLGRPDGAGPGKWRQVSGPGGLLSLSIYFCSVFLLFNSFATVLN